MNKKKRSTVSRVIFAGAMVVATLTFSTTVFASEGLESIVKNMSDKKTFQADVTQVNSVKGVGNETFSGKVYIEYGDRAYWGYTTPSKQIYLIDGDSVIYYDELLEQVFISSKESLQGDLLLGLMSDVGSLVENFNIKNLGTGAFSLVPKRSASTIKRVEVYINNETIERVRSYDHRGNVIEMTFTNVVLGGKISKSKFEIKYPKDVQVIRR